MGAKFKEFNSNDATVAASGKEVENWKKISYNEKQEGVLNYAGNNKANSYSVGKIQPECKIELYMSAIRELEKSAKETTGSTSLLGLPPLQWAVTYTNDDLEEVTDVIHFKIISQGREINGGADGLAYELETLCLGIDYAVS